MLKDHAPDPWHIEDNGKAQGVLIVDSQDKVVAWIPHTEHSEQTVKSNARLISIAPKLLKLLNFNDPENRGKLFDTIDSLVHALAEHHNPDECDNCDTCRLIQSTNALLNEYR